MITIGAFEAKTHLSSLLDKVEAGEEIVITRHGRAVARLVSESAAEDKRLDDAVRRLRSLRATTTLGNVSWKTLRDAGRK